MVKLLPEIGIAHPRTTQRCMQGVLEQEEHAVLFRRSSQLDASFQKKLRTGRSRTKGLWGLERTVEKRASVKTGARAAKRKTDIVKGVEGRVRHGLGLNPRDGQREGRGCRWAAQRKRRSSMDKAASHTTELVRHSIMPGEITSEQDSGAPSGTPLSL